MNKQKPLPVPESVAPKLWHDGMSIDDLATIAEARTYAERWTGATNNSPLILIDKLVKMLDERGG